MEFLVTLQRDSLQTPWGFRLEGGRDFKQPLSVQRVFTGTPASSDLLRGDVIISIHNEDASSLFHQEANELIRTSGGSLHLGIRRTAGAENSQFQPFQSYKHTIDFSKMGNHFQAFHAPEEEDLSKRYRSKGIEGYKNPKPILSQTGSSHLPNYQPFTVGECSSVQRYTANKLAPKCDLTFAKPSYPRFNSTNHSAAPYVDRRMIGNIQQNLTRAVHAPHSSFTSKAVSTSSLPSSHMKIGKYDVKSFAQLPTTFPRAPSATGSNAGSYHSSSSQVQPKSQMVTKQYNSPIGLYSNSTLKEELNKQIDFNNHAEFSNANTNSASEF